MSTNKWRVRRAPWDEHPWEVSTLAESGWVPVKQFQGHLGAITYADAKAWGQSELAALYAVSLAYSRAARHDRMRAIEASHEAERAAERAARHIAAAKRRKQLEAYRER